MLMIWDGALSAARLLKGRGKTHVAQLKEITRQWGVCRNPPSRCTQCSERVSPTAGITLKWHHSFQASLLAQQPCWMDGVALWHPKENLTELHLCVRTCCRHTLVCLPLLKAPSLFLCDVSTNLSLCASLCWHKRAHISPPASSYKNKESEKTILIRTFILLFALSDVQSEGGTRRLTPSLNIERTCHPALLSF